MPGRMDLNLVKIKANWRKSSRRLAVFSEREWVNIRRLNIKLAIAVLGKEGQILSQPLPIVSEVTYRRM